MKKFNLFITEFRDVTYADVPHTKARLLAKGFKVDEIQISHNCHKDTYKITATHIE